ncbi:TPA: HNH endonuclease signature motif containing protein [Enterococcus faecium]|nr:HNH endonuclease signature motif containing protein [Listeria monocytogenes]
MCLKEGRFTSVEIVHHIKELSDGGTHDENNLMSVCKSCHSKIHMTRRNTKDKTIM